jgi:hypothetical protein
MRPDDGVDPTGTTPSTKRPSQSTPSILAAQSPSKKTKDSAFEIVMLDGVNGTEPRYVGPALPGTSLRLTMCVIVG